MHATEFVESYFDAWNRQDPKGVADHLTADGIYCDISSNVKRSHDELIAGPGDEFFEFPYRYKLIGEILVSENTIAFQYRMSSNEEIGKEASAEHLRGAEFMTLHGDAAMTINDYYDIPDVAQPSTLARMAARQMHRQKYAKSGLNSRQLIEYKHRLEQIMRSNKLFLWSDLTLPKLAKAVDCSVNHLSQVINSGFDMSFFDYVNEYRIRYAKDLLSGYDGENIAILNIASTVGFNSNSAFFAAFKKHVGKTPAQYRRTQLDQPH